MIKPKTAICVLLAIVGCSGASARKPGAATDDGTSDAEIAPVGEMKPNPKPSVMPGQNFDVASVDAAAAPTPPMDSAPMGLPPSRDTGVAGVAVDGLAVPPDIFVGLPCDKSGALVCEDFESGKIDSSKWSIFMNQSAVTVDMPKVPGRGKYALHVTPTSPTAEVEHFGSITSTKVFPIAGKSLFIRGMVFLEGISTHRHMNVFRSIGGNRGLDYVVNATPAWNAPYLPTSFRLLWYHDGGGEPVEFYGKPPTQTPMGKWACWEWEIRGSNNELHFWLDGVKPPGLFIPAAMNWTAPTNARMRFGMESYHAVSPGFSLWIDDIAISDKRIGCGPPP